MKLQKQIFLLLFLSWICLSSSWAYGIKLNTPQAFNGYTLMQNWEGVYLVNNCGEILNSWDIGFSNLHPKLLENGNLLYIDFAGKIIERNWDGEIEIEIINTDNDLELKYEVIKMKSGNYLSVGRRSFGFNEFENIGYDLSNGVNPTEVDVVVEFNTDGEIVWEWNISEHVIQERDVTLANYGSIKDNPQLLSMDAVSRVDWTSQESFMINGMDYNEDLDLIAVSVRKISEVVIIDHSTTAEEVTGHEGGFHGKGGDALYRWGNPANYGRGDEEDRRLWFQHNPNWIEHGEHLGKMIIFNNGLNRPFPSFQEKYSSAPVIELPLDENGAFVLENDEAFEPSIPAIEYDKIQTNSSFYSDYTSGAKVLGNGNVLITSGKDGMIKEYNPFGILVWEYELVNGEYIFRAEKYSVDYPAFEGKELIPNGTIESPSSSYECDLVLANEEAEITPSTFNVIQSNSNIVVSSEKEQEFKIELYTIFGQKIKTDSARNGISKLGVILQNKGIYLLNIYSKSGQIFETHKLFIE